MCGVTDRDGPTTLSARAGWFFNRYELLRNPLGIYPIGDVPGPNSTRSRVGALPQNTALLLHNVEMIWRQG